MEFWQVVEARHSVRDFKDAPVPRDVLERIVHAASVAPSAMNEQPWRFHVTTGETRSQLGKVVSQATVHLSEYMEVLGPKRYEDAMKWYSSLGDAPVVIGVSMPTPESDFDNMNRLLSIGAAVENLMLAATAEGLGCCNITFSWWVRTELEELLGIGPGRSMVSIVALGYPSSVPPALPPKNEDVADWLD